MKPETARSLASFFIPPLTAAVLIYQVLTNLQIGVTHGETLVVIGVALGAAGAAGALAAFGGEFVRITVLALSAVLLLDAAIHLPYVFARLHPESRAIRARNAKRTADLHQLQAALETYKRDVGSLPRPSEYGEGVGPATFWRDWWDLSTHDGDGDGRYFLDFLVESGVISFVPLDPLNKASDSEDPRSGFQYVYYVAPAGSDYEGGICPAAGGRSMYLLAVTRLESDAEIPRERFSGPGCKCLWRDRPNFFQDHFDYLLCGTVEQ